MQGENHAPCTFHKNFNKKMDKKIYFDPKSEVVELKLRNAILVGSGEDEGDPVSQGGGEGEETPGGW